MAASSTTFKSLALEIKEFCEEDSLDKENMSNITAYLKNVSLKHEKTKVSSLQDSLDELHTQKELAKILCREMDQFCTKEMDVNHRIEEIESVPVIPNTHRKEIELFEKDCGLTLKSENDGSMALIFTNVDPNNFNRQFSITISVQENSETRHWIVVSSDPQLDGILELVSDLNRTNDLHLFCLQLRNLYKQNC